MNKQLFGMERKEKIEEFIKNNPYVGTAYLQKLFFNFSTGERKCRHIMASMVRDKQLKRFRYGEYVYYHGSKKDNWKQEKAISDFYCRLLLQLTAEDNIIYYQRHFLFSEALFIVKFKQGGIKFFLEFNDEKIDKYVKYMERLLWLNEYFADPLQSGKKSFPVILILSDKIVINNKVKVITCLPEKFSLKIFK